MNCSVKFFEPTVIVLPEALGIFLIALPDEAEPLEPLGVELEPELDEDELSLPHAATPKARQSAESRREMRFTLTEGSSWWTGRAGDHARSSGPAEAGAHGA